MPSDNLPPHEFTPHAPQGDAGALSAQVGGEHYKNLPIQPVTYAMANELGFVEGAVVKYVSRWKQKGGVEDLKKARHFLDLLIEYVEANRPSGD